MRKALLSWAAQYCVQQLPKKGERGEYVTCDTPKLSCRCHTRCCHAPVSVEKDRQIGQTFCR